MRSRTGMLVAAAACVAALTACTRKSSADPHSAASAAAHDTAPPPLTPQGRAEMLAIKQAMDSLEPEVGRIQSADAATQHRQLAEHERLSRQFLARIDTRIRDMHTTVDPSFAALVDSVRTDLDRMRGMPPAALHAYLPGHLGRLMHIASCINTYGL